MDRLVDIATGMVRNSLVVARVRARGTSTGMYLCQVSGRDVDFIARSDTLHAPGDDVLVMLEPSEHTPHIIGLSPWASNSVMHAATNNGASWTVADIVAGQLDDAVHSNAEVVEMVALQHARLHSWLSASDHSDVAGTPSDKQVLCYDGSTWRPVTLSVGAMDGGTR